MRVSDHHNSWANSESFTKQFLLGRYFTAFSTILILSFIGSTYIFGLYSGEIKSTFGYDQSTLNLISFYKDLGAYISVHAGLLTEVAPVWVVLLIGAAVNFVGYFMIWLSVTSRIAHTQVWQMCLYICIGANSMGFAHTGAFVTCVKNFPGYRGSVIGILKAYIGLGGAIMAQLYHALYGNTNAKGVILLIAWLPAIPLVLFAYSIRVVKVVERQLKREIRFFNNILYMSLTLAAFLMVMIIVQRKVDFSHGGYGVSSAVMMVLLILPILLVIREERAAWKSKHDKIASDGLSELKVVEQEDVTDSNYQPTCSSDPKEPTEKHVSCFQDVFNPPPAGENHTILQATFSINMLLVMLAQVCVAGGHLTTIDNLAQLGSSLGYPKKSLITLISLMAIWQYLGRVLGGVISEYFLTKYKVPRPIFFAITIFLSGIAHLLIAVNAPHGLYASIILVGFCLGAGGTCLFAIVSEIFGLKYYATLSNYCPLAIPLASYIFNVRVAGHLYDKEGLRQLAALGLTRKPGQELTCKGVQCYQMTYIILTAVAFFGTILCLILAYRTRDYYRSDIYQRFRSNHKLSSNDDQKSSLQKEELQA